jgi:hypothetical protein
MMYYYRIKFNDGRVVIRTHVRKNVAESMHKAMVEESILFDVQEVSWGRCS